MSLTAALAALALSVAPPPGEAPVAEPLTIGTSYALTTHDAERHIHVVPPQGYAEGEDAYPVILMLDGGLKQDFFLTLGLERWNQLWGRSAPALFVAVETVDRQRELLPPTADEGERDRYPSAGESAAFRAFLADDVLPLLRARYRTDGRVMLVGESAAGHFVVETWAEAPHLFDGYAALSPSLQWNGQSLSRQPRLGDTGRPPLFLSLADEGGATEEGVLRVLSSAGSPVCFADRRADLVHANSLHGLLPEALQFLLPTQADWLETYGLTMSCVAMQGRGGDSAPSE